MRVAWVALLFLKRRTLSDVTLCVTLFIEEEDFMSSTVTIRLNDQEKQLFTTYSQFCNEPLSTLFKKTLEAKIEDDLDLTAIKEYEADLEKNAVTYYSHEEVKDILE